MGVVVAGPWCSGFGDTKRVLLAHTVWDRARCEPFCDPRRVALGLGLRTTPDVTATEAYVDGDALIYPAMCSLMERGQGIYRAISRYMLGRLSTWYAQQELTISELTAELILPREIAEQVSHERAVELQKHAPTQLVESIWRWQCGQARQIQLA